MQYVSSDNDVLDLICHRYYQGRAGFIEAVLEANPFLSKYPPILPAGVVIELPSLELKETVNQISLWD